MTLEFKRPPLIEVTARLVLDDSRPLPMSIPFLIDLNDQLKSIFPNVTDLPRFEESIGQQPLLSISTGIRPAGARFARSTDGIALHIQANQIVCRWVKGSNFSNKESEYPGFEIGIKAAIEFAVEQIERLMGTDYVTPQIVNMSYSNYIVFKSPARFADVASYVTLFASPVAKGDDTLRNCEISFRRHDKIDLKVSVQATMSDNINENGIVLVTAAGMYIEQKPNQWRSELHRVHEVIGEVFRDHITDLAKSEWEML